MPIMCVKTMNPDALDRLAVPAPTPSLVNRKFLPPHVANPNSSKESSKTASLSKSSPLRTRSIPIPRGRRAPHLSHASYVEEARRVEREDEEYEQLRQMYDCITWKMYHRIQEHRNHHQTQKQMARLAGHEHMIPFAAPLPRFPDHPTSLVSLLPMLLTELSRPDHIATEEDEELIFGELEDDM